MSISKPPQHKLALPEKGSDRSSSVNKNAVKLNNVVKAYEPRKKDPFTSTQINFTKKKLMDDHIEGNFNVPDVFLKTKYGALNVYNYDIKESNNEGEDLEDSPPKSNRIQERSKSKDLAAPVIWISPYVICIERKKIKWTDRLSSPANLWI